MHPVAWGLSAIVPLLFLLVEQFESDVPWYVLVVGLTIVIACVLAAGCYF